MTLAPAPVRPATAPVRGRHRGSDDTSSTALADLLAQAPRTGASHRSPAAPSLGRAARTAGLSLAALGALATAGGVATQGFDGADEPTATGEFSVGPQLAAADLAVAPKPSVAAVSAPAVLPATAPAATPAAAATPVVASSKAAAKAPTATTTKAKPAADTSDDEDESSSEGSSTAQEALAAAKSKIGKPYVWGATGPNSFDCSGLTSWAFKQAGTSIPRTSSAQSKAGTKVSVDSLQPGDLVFFYSPVSHVAMYIGDGKIIEAPNSGSNVRIRPLSQYKGDIVGARRMG